MNRVLEYIEQKRHELAALPFIHFVQDRDVDPRVRLGFAPCLAPMAMGFSDLMVYGLRDASSKDRLQQVLNSHTVVDERHWLLFLEDLKTLGFNESMPLTSALQFVYGEHSAKARLVIYTLIALVRGISPILRLATLEAIEVGADVGFSRFRAVGSELSEKIHKPLFYFGQSHQDQEDQHEEMEADSIRALISSYPWTPEEEEKARKLADDVFVVYAEMGNSLLAYAQKAREQGPLWPLRSLQVEPGS
jgi:hypothetical protein